MAVSLDQRVEQLQLLADPTRLRLLALLARQPLSVADLVRVTGLGQSRVSTHLARLRDAGLVVDRRDGASRIYRPAEGAEAERFAPMLGAAREALADDLLEGDQRRLDAMLDARRTGDAWLDAVAGRMERHYSPGRTWEALARGVMPLVSLGEVLDVGSGDGVLASLLAPRAERYVCVDRNARVLAAAGERLAGLDHVELVRGEMAELPLPDAAFDTALVFHVLTYAEDPAAALREFSRVTREGGRLVVVTLAAHHHQSDALSYGHVHPGFAPETLYAWLEDAGFEDIAVDITSRESKPPHYEVLTATAIRGAEKTR